MKIVHICLSGQYIDGWGYQENLLPHYLHMAGTENIVVTSSNSFPAYVKSDTIKDIISKGRDYEYDGVRIIRIPTLNPTPSLAFAPSLFRTIEEIGPDVIFHHDVVFTTLGSIRRYVRKHPAVLFVDNHADELNMSRHALWNLIYHKIANRAACMHILPYVKFFYGVTPARCAFLEKYYVIPSSKISLLPIGADIQKSDSILSKDDLRVKYGFGLDDRIVVSGGKMGKNKGTDILISAVSSIGCKLVLFGSFSDIGTLNRAENTENVTVFNWCDREKTLELLKLADVACWPVHHTTLIEDAVSVQTPLLVRETGNTRHLVKGNGMWTSVDTLRDDLTSFFSADYSKFLHAAMLMKKEISYETIARRVIDDARK